jgi:hypothetical protein
MQWNREWLRRLVDVEVGMVVGELLDVIFNKAVDVPFEHGTVNIEAKLLSDVFVDPFRVRRAAHAFNTKEFKVTLLKVMEAMAGDCVVDASELWHEASRRRRRHYR